MKNFFEEYGFVILASIVVIVLIAMCTPIGNSVRTQIESLTTGFSDKTENKLNVTFDNEQVPISTVTNYIGSYADIDGDGTVDGVIFADLAFSKSGTWNINNAFSSYSYSSVSDLKQYYVSQESYEGDFGTSVVLSPINGTTGNDRFYVMAVANIGKSWESYYWYYSARSTQVKDWNIITSKDFGAGKSNTTNMISAWNNKTYGEQNAKDIWALIQVQVNNGWFVPSSAEWSAFGDALSVTGDNYSGKKLPFVGWTSSLNNSILVLLARSHSGQIGGSYIDGGGSIRLATTF